jgi:hypothetical protein
MRLKEPYVRKHVHSWQKSGEDASGGRAWIERTCSDCGKIQHGCVYDYDRPAESIVHLADTVWYDGAMPQKTSQYPW